MQIGERIDQRDADAAVEFGAGRRIRPGYRRG